MTFRADLEIIERSLQRLQTISYKDYLATEEVHCKIILVATEEHAVSMQKLIGMAIQRQFLLGTVKGTSVGLGVPFWAAENREGGFILLEHLAPQP